MSHGRSPDSVRFLSSVEIVVDSTQRAAQAKADELARYTDLEGGLVLLSALSGVDSSTYGVDRPIEQFETDASQSILATVDDSDGLRQRITLRDYVGGLGGFGGPLFVGDASTVADGLADFAAETGVDGFNIAYHVTPGSFADVAEYLDPRAAVARIGDRGPRGHVEATAVSIRFGAAARRTPRCGTPEKNLGDPITDAERNFPAPCQIRQQYVKSLRAKRMRGGDDARGRKGGTCPHHNSASGVPVAH